MHTSMSGATHSLVSKEASRDDNLDLLAKTLLMTPNSTQNDTFPGFNQSGDLQSHEVVMYDRSERLDVGTFGCAPKRITLHMCPLREVSLT